MDKTWRQRESPRARSKVALYAGLVVASPVWLYELLAFVSPGLTAQERRFFFPILAAVAVLFLLGTAFGYVPLVVL
jgi:sec-independent protein translocase protein TatC